MLEINSLYAGYSKKNMILQNINFNIERGKIIGILGGNGAGKTTLFETIYGNLKYTGSILIDRKKIEKSNISYLQTENYFYKFVTVRDILSLFQNKSNAVSINKLIQFFNLPETEFTQNLSYGTGKKLAITCNLLLDRELYILDEPFNGLDFESVEKLYLLINTLKERKKMVLMSSHILETLTYTCDIIYYIKQGSFIAKFSKDNFETIKTFVKNEMQIDYNEYLT